MIDAFPVHGERARAIAFLAQFVERGWLSVARESATEVVHIRFGLAQGWLRRQLNVVYLTPSGLRILRGV